MSEIAGRKSESKASRTIVSATPVANRVLAVAVMVGLLGTGGCGEARRTLVLGIPTTIQDSGLLDELLPRFEGAYPEYRMRYIAAGSGELLALGARGDVDVLLAHSPRAEEQFMEAGHGAVRHRVMENDFLIVGPHSDPASIRGLEDAAAALGRIAAASARFLSRGDDSGTHRKELELWVESGRDDRGAGYREAGQGMGAVLLAASEIGAYALCDRATFENLKASLNLEVVVEGDSRLLNVYHVIVVARAGEVEAARSFANWLVSAEAQSLIRAYGRERLGVSVYRPAAGPETIDAG